MGPTGPNWTVGTGLSLSGGTLSADATYFIRNQNASAQAATWWINGMVRMGSETGTGEPGYYGIIVRHAYSTSLTSGSVVARAGSDAAGIRLHRDGTNGGLAYTTTGGYEIQCLLISSGGGVSAYVATPASGTGTVFANAANIVRFDCSFGDFYLGGYSTHVVMGRRAGDWYWMGFLESNYNQ